jgi:hypothetical protein
METHELKAGLTEADGRANLADWRAKAAVAQKGKPVRVCVCVCLCVCVFVCVCECEDPYVHMGQQISMINRTYAVNRL